MAEDTSNENSNSDYLFQHLVAMFQTLALQQLGKLINPITGKLERDLQQAKITIDMVRMIQKKTAGNLKEDEKAVIDRVLMELQMNYVDELRRKEEEPQEEESKEAVAEDGSGSEDPQAMASDSKPAGKENVGKRRRKKKEE